MFKNVIPTLGNHITSKFYLLGSHIICICWTFWLLWSSWVNKQIINLKSQWCLLKNQTYFLLTIMPKASWVFNSSPNSSKAATFKTFDSSIYQPYICIKLKKKKQDVLPNLVASSKLKESIMARVLFIKSCCLTTYSRFKTSLSFRQH
jgi:hypothetical protein